MTESERKIYEAVQNIATEQARFNTKFDSLNQTVSHHTTNIDMLVGDRNKIIGVSWLGGGLITLGAVIWQFFK